MSRPALACALAAGTMGAFAVAGQRVGLGLAVVLLLIIAAAWVAAPEEPSWPLMGLALALAVQPVLRDAGWVVAAAGVAAPVAAAAAVIAPVTWRAAALAAATPLRLIAGHVAIARGLRALARPGASDHAGALARGLALAILLTGCFGALFVTADSAFAELADKAVGVELEFFDVVWRFLVALAFAGAAAAVAAVPRRPRAEAREQRFVAGRIELLVGLGALVVLFSAFVAVQLRVLFGGAGYVQETTGLGYGEYARQGFVALLAVAALTLGVIAVAARRRDRAVRALLATLCGLTLVILASAHHRLDLVEDAYGLTRVRYGGHAIVAWLAVVFAIVLAAGARARAARMAPRAVVLVTLAGVLAFSLSNPDARIAQAAVDRHARTGDVDADYLRGLSADALQPLRRLPAGARGEVMASIRARLRRPDGIAGLNLARARAR